MMAAILPDRTIDSQSRKAAAMMPRMDDLLAAIEVAGLPPECFGPEETDAISDAKGAYALLLRLDAPVGIQLRMMEPTSLLPGWFVYCGSAKGPGGLRARLRRHFRRDKALHWHIDRLTAVAAGIAAVPLQDGDECALVAALLKSRQFDVATTGFGSSDCRQCDSHLLRYRGPAA